MNVVVTALVAGFVTALRFAALPALVGLAAFSVLWKRKKGAWIPLWKLGAVLLGVTVLATIVFAARWSDAVGASP